MPRRAGLEAAGGAWSEDWDAVEELDPAFLEAYIGLAAVPWRSGPLEPKIKELLLLAVDAAVTHLHRPGISEHVAGALRHGATPAEGMEVLELSAVLGIHTCTVAVPILLDELEAAGRGDEVDLVTPTPRQAQLKADFERVRGYWTPLWDGVLALDPDFFEAYFRFSAVPFEHGALEPKVKELVYIAVDVSTTHLFEPGTRIHIRNALAHGATAAEIMEVFELAAAVGMQTVTTAAPVLAQELGR
jgi:alkylhydroperoxidase/carboxymuconolactone decarboxylase family protein YurZ